MNEWLLTALSLWFALLLDRCIGEPTRFHPLVAFGSLAAWFEKQQNDQPGETHSKRKGAISVLCVTLPFVALFGWLHIHLDGYAKWAMDTFVLYLCVGHQSLRLHAQQIAQPLMYGDLSSARHFTSYMVSRDTRQLSEQDISRATVESVLENGNDAVIASLFYFAIGGPALAVLHRLINTLDAMWGYKNARFLHFGWAAAKADDILAWPTAWLTALLYAIQSTSMGITENLQRSVKQSRHYKSANGGLVMAAGAHTLAIQLGGGTSKYHGQTLTIPHLGKGIPPASCHIAQSLRLVSLAAYGFCLIVSIAIPLFFIKRVLL